MRKLNSYVKLESYFLDVSVHETDIRCPVLGDEYKPRLGYPRLRMHSAGIQQLRTYSTMEKKCIYICVCPYMCACVSIHVCVCVCYRLLPYLCSFSCSCVWLTPFSVATSLAYMSMWFTTWLSWQLAWIPMLNIADYNSLYNYFYHTIATSH